MHMIAGVLQYVAVASFAEAWIEKTIAFIHYVEAKSPPSRRRGLKIVFCISWYIPLCRLLRGGVD